MFCATFIFQTRSSSNEEDTLGKFRRINRNLPQAKRRPRRESSPYICDFSRGGLNTRLYTLVSKPCSEATNIGARLSSGAVLWLGREILFIAGGIWGISRRFWLSVELFFEGLTRIIVVVR